MKLRLLVVLLFLLSTIYADNNDANPEDIDDVQPPINEDGQKGEQTVTKFVTTSKAPVPTSNRTTTIVKISQIAVSANSTELQSKSDSDKKEELLTGKDDTPSTNTNLFRETTTIAAESVPPLVPKIPEKEIQEEEKENAAPEFEAKQEVEGGKGEEDPDANVDKPAAVDPPKDEADGAAKEDRETPAVGAEGLHEAVEEARGNPAPGVPAADKKKDSADEEQTLEAGPVPRPYRLDSSNEYQSSFHHARGSPEEGTGFMSFFLVASFLIIAIYLLQQNKKKILGLIFEGRNVKSGSRRNAGNVRYRRLSQNDSGN